MPGIPTRLSYRHISGDPGKIRLGYVTARDLVEHGTVVFLKENYPELFRKLLRAFPEMGRYA